MRTEPFVVRALSSNTYCGILHKYCINRDPATLYTENPKCHHNVSLYLIDCIKQRGIKYQTARCTEAVCVCGTLFQHPDKVCDPGVILWIFLQMFRILRKYFSLHVFVFYDKCVFTVSFLNLSAHWVFVSGHYIYLYVGVSFRDSLPGLLSRSIGI